MRDFVFDGGSRGLQAPEFLVIDERALAPEVGWLRIKRRVACG